MEQGQGCRLTDCDGNTYIDFLSNYTSLVHGHNHPAVLEATRAQLERGTVFGSASSTQADLAEVIAERVPSMEKMRFCNSGTEATLMAMRAARLFSGKDIIVKMDGGYHGSHDWAEVNFIPAFEEGPVPPMHVEDAGVPRCILEAMQVARFNDLNSVEIVLKQHADRIAGIITEPMPGSLGMVPPRPGFLQGLRDLADKYEVLLIFDEIITFRLSLGGVQRLQGVQPDVTALAKIIGGGFAVGAFGGRADVMARFDPAHPQAVMHSGTFSGHNVTMAAGIATLRHYGQAEIDRINALGARLREGFNRAFAQAGIKGQTTGMGSLMQVHFRDGEIVNPRDTGVGILGSKDLPRLLHLEMLNRGIFSAPRGMYCVSTPMGDKEIDECIDAFAAALEVLRPYAAEVTPHLLAG
jgi:glutamate-1-semialdehyde 2,1-aminomutase